MTKFTQLPSITLTQDQIDSIVQPYLAKFEKDTAAIQAAAERSSAGVKRRADARVERAKARTTQWIQHYNSTRTALLKANGEIVVLKRRLRNGDWDQP